MRTTINDIARIANVSPSTVSRVLANSPRISSATRDRVLEIMKEMNYHPNMIARSLANKSTNIIAVVIPGATEKAFQHPFFPEIIRGITSIAHKYYYNILISSVTNTKEEKQVISDFAKGGIAEGIILMTSRVKDPSISELNKMKFPFVVVGRPVNEQEVNWVDNDNVSVSYALTEHFIARGHKKIAFMGVDPNFIVTVDRLEGYKKALADHGIPMDERLVIDGPFNDDTGYDLAGRLFESQKDVTGIIACDDFLAFGAIKYCKEQGMNLPEDIAIAGFNNVPISDYLVPSLTSVEVNAFGLGSKAFELLYSNINSGVKGYNRAIVPAELVIRSSTSSKF